MKKVLAALILCLLLVSVAVAAPGFPWNYNLWEDQAISPTPISQSFTLENTTVGNVYYHFTGGVTATNSIVVDESYDGEVFVSQQGTAALNATTTEASGIITLTMDCPDVTVYLSTTTATGVATVGVWQR